MSKICSKCGQRYPDNFNTCTCRLCGGTIERYRDDLVKLHYKDYLYEEQWHEWQEKYAAAPHEVLTEDAWYDTCAFFNSCSICGAPDIDEKLLVVPPYLGGKLYTHNVVPACRVCAKRIRQSQAINPVKSFYTIDGSDKHLVDTLFKYLEAVMFGTHLEFFNYEEDSIEITFICTEATSITPFTGIYAKRTFDPIKLQILPRATKYDVTRPQETVGVTWRLVDESDFE